MKKALEMEENHVPDHKRSDEQRQRGDHGGVERVRPRLRLLESESDRQLRVVLGQLACLVGKGSHRLDGAYRLLSNLKNVVNIIYKIENIIRHHQPCQQG